MTKVTVPDRPTHAVHFRDNWDGEGDTYFVFVFKHEDVYLSHETGIPLLHYEGDKILASWELNQ